MRLTDKVCVVTGASQGFGETIAQLFASEGAAVVCADILDDQGEAVAESIRASGGKAVYQHTNVADRADTRGMVERAVSEFGRLDVVVNNAGYSHSNKPIMEVTDEDYDRIMDVNVRSIFLEVQEAHHDQVSGRRVGTGQRSGKRDLSGHW